MTTILIVEDNDVTRQLWAGILEDKGYRTIHSADGSAALDTIRQGGQLDLILLDQRMSPMDGFEFARKLREDKISIPVIMLTADPSSDLLLQAQKYHIHQILKKPVQPERLHQVVERALGRGRAFHTGRPTRLNNSEIRDRLLKLADSNFSEGLGANQAAFVFSAAGELLGEGRDAVLRRHEIGATAVIEALNHTGKRLRTADLSGHRLVTARRPDALDVAAAAKAGIACIEFALDENVAEAPDAIRLDGGAAGVDVRELD